METLTATNDTLDRAFSLEMEQWNMEGGRGGAVVETVKYAQSFE
jgi:hypothetical protein